MNVSRKISRLFSHKTVRYGLPFMLFIVGGSVGLREFTDLRYRYQPKVTTAELFDMLEKHGISTDRVGKVTLESEYEKMKNMDFDNWENKRIPRPWDEVDESQESS